MTGRVKLQNSNKEFSREVHSANGDSVQIMANAVVDVDEKFNWRLPPDVSVFRPKHTVFSKKGAKEIAHKADAVEQGQDVSNDRPTIVSENTPIPPTGAKKA